MLAKRAPTPVQRPCLDSEETTTTNYIHPLDAGREISNESGGPETCDASDFQALRHEVIDSCHAALHVTSRAELTLTRSRARSRPTCPVDMADSRMEEEASDVYENSEEDFGWQVATGRRSHGVSGGGTGPANATAAIKNRIIKASRMPQLPEEHHKIIIRPRGGLNLSKVSTTAIGTAVIEASGLTAEQASEDVVCPNFTQNMVVVSTPEPDDAARYVRIKSFKILETEYEVNAYETAPHATCKGVIRRVDIRPSQSAITRNIVHERNPLALAAKRIKTSGSVIFLFDGLKVPKFVRYGPTLVRCYLYRKQFDVCFTSGRVGHRSDVCPTPDSVQCRGCGALDPPVDHVCTPKCKFCGGNHPTGDKACRQRAPVETSHPTPCPTPSLQQGPRGRSHSRSRAKSRRRSLPRERSRSKTRGASVSLEDGAPGAKPIAGTAWADKVKGAVRIAGGAATPAVTEDSDARIEQLIREVNALRKANEELTKQVVELKKKAQPSSARVAVARPVSQSTEPSEGDSSPASKKRAVSTEIDSVFSVLSELKEVIKEIRETTERTNFKVDKLWNWRLTAEQRFKKLETRYDDDDEFLPSDSESVKSLPGTSGGAPKRTIAGNSKMNPSNNHG
ncbi:hypothetical protein HPB52_021882 [Rhipicephalus sanguineus]|uniref:Uncharacterized protein n=1 Tax=Rhipicephalus sanguineus TaxID=34632 RepID=A0A9D4PI06_RHISA|nr:hypothetical protein HPB52_021882 [Rhipicephalus sanguineus]